MPRTLQVGSLPLAALVFAATTPAIAHPGPHHEVSLGEGVAHVLSSADHLGMLVFAGLAVAAAVTARVMLRMKEARAKAKWNVRRPRT